MRSLFLTGLKRQTGKTIIAAGLAGTMQSLSYSTGYLKTVQTGSLLQYESRDVEYINSIDPNIKTFFSYSLQNTSSPLVGAFQTEFKKINIQKINNDCQAFIHSNDFNIIEGSNSISTPVDEKSTEIDVIKTLGIPLILVVNAQKSSIDEIISGVSYIKSHKLGIFGIIINEYDIESENLEQKYLPHLIKEYTSGTKILGCFPHLQDIYPDTLIAQTLNSFNLEEIFGLEIAKLR